MSKCKCVCCDHDDEKPQWKYMKSELREKNKMSQMQDALKVLEKLKQENARLQKALNVYADKNMWYRSAHSIFDDHFCAAVCNAWEIAKKALEKSK